MDFRQALPVGSILVDDYRITDVLGQGGFGLTYKADDLRLGAPAAIKEYFPGDLALREPGRSTVVARSARDEEVLAWGRAKFLEEARTLARFRHPNIVRVARLFEANNTAYMVLDFEMGPSLSQWRAALGRAPTQGEIDRIAGKLLEAVAAVHADGILHRDIKPANVIMRDGNEPVLIDFGAARQALSAQSKTVHAIVTPGYSPKEQYAVDLDRQGAWSDIYALGATLYFLVTGKAPPDALSRDLDVPMPMATTSAGDWRPGFLEAIDAAMTLNAEARPQSVAAWRAMLLGESAQGNRTRSPVTQAGIGRSAASTQAAGPTGAPGGAPGAAVRRVTFDDIPSSQPYASDNKPRKSSGGIIAAAMVAGALALGGLWYWVTVIAPQRDAEAWARATRIDTAAAYEGYLSEQPSGRHVTAARERRAAALAKAVAPKQEQQATQGRERQAAQVEARQERAPETAPIPPSSVEREAIDAKPDPAGGVTPNASPVQPSLPPPPEPASQQATLQQQATNTQRSEPASPSQPPPPVAPARPETAASLPPRAALPAGLSDADASTLAASASETTWRLAIAGLDQQDRFGEQRDQFVEELTRLSVGKLKVNAAPRTSGPTQAEATARRTLGEKDLMVWHSPATMWEQRVFGLFAGAVPYGLQPAAHVRWMRGEGAQLLERAYDSRGIGVRAIPCGISGGAGAWFRREIRSPTNFNGLRVFAPPLMTDALSRLGARRVELASATEVSGAVRRLDAVMWLTPLIGQLGGRTRPLPVYHFPGAHSPTVMMDLLIGLATWQAMSPAQRRLIDEACRRNLDRGATLSQSAQRAALSSIRTQRTVIRPFTGPVREAIQKAVEEILAENAQRDPLFREVAETYIRYR